MKAFFSATVLVMSFATSALAAIAPATHSTGLNNKQSSNLTDSKTLTCDTGCQNYLKSTFEAKGAVEAGSTYSEAKCVTQTLEKSVIFNVGSKHSKTLGAGRGLMNARIRMRCIPYSGRDPVIIVRNFTIDADLHICERKSLSGKVNSDICPNLTKN